MTTSAQLSPGVELNDDVLTSMLFTPGHRRGNWGVSFAQWGPPGVGKSTRILDVSENEGLPVVVRYASIHDPTDFAGMPIVKDGYVSMVPLQWVKELVDLGDCTLFIDEITTAPPATQNALLAVMLERKIGDLALPLGVRVVVAGNPASMAVSGRDLGVAQSNRVAHFQTELSVDKWMKYMLGLTDQSAYATTLSAPTAKARDHQADVLSKWGPAFAETLGLCTAFVNTTQGTSNPAANANALDTLYKLPEEDDAEYGGAWPSPRSWEMFARALAGARIHKLGLTDQLNIAQACLGSGVGSSLAQWLAYSDLPDPVSILDGGEVFAHNNQSPARTVIAMLACSRFIMDNLNDGRAKNRIDKFWAVMLSFVQERPDLVAICSRELCKTNPALTKIGALDGLGRQVLMAVARTGIIAT